MECLIELSTNKNGILNQDDQWDFNWTGCLIELSTNKNGIPSQDDMGF
jgi:hypothetical protein